MLNAASLTLIASSLLTLALTQSVLASDTGHNYRLYEPQALRDDPRTFRNPELGAAHALSLASDLHTEYLGTDETQIQQFGPWLTDDGISHNAQVLIRTIQDAGIHGLNPEAYQLTSILRTVDTLGHLDSRHDANLPERRIDSSVPTSVLRLRLNELLDTNFVKLITHLGKGVVDGRALQSRLYRDAPRINAFNFLVALNNAELSVGEVINLTAPSHPDYKRLTRKMRDLLTEKSTSIYRTKVAKENDSRLVSETEDKQRIRERLLETGDLTFGAYLAINSDAELLKALRAFQTRHGLEVSSFADIKTRAALNASVDDEIEAVALNLERWRWLPRSFGDKHIMVNIPDYTVNLVIDQKTTLTMPVVVGKIRHQTPSFSRDMSYMEFNPTWTVPASITNKELIPRERRRPGYLVSRQFDFLKYVNNRLVKVPASSVTRRDFNSARFPYVLRQRGGPINALGRMKFMMPNQYAIYLHDTQAKKHFTLNDRAYSHGCIRLSDPDALAQHLMSADGYSQKQIDKSFASKKTHRIRFREPIPTHLVYLTTWVDDSGALQHRPDIYLNNEATLEALRTANTLISGGRDAARKVASNESEGI